MTKMIFPTMMKGITGKYAGPMLKKKAKTGENDPTEIPVKSPQDMTDTTKIKLTTEPVISCRKNGSGISVEKANCKTTSSAVKTAVRVTHRMFFRMFTKIPPTCILMLSMVYSPQNVCCRRNILGRLILTKHIIPPNPLLEGLADTEKLLLCLGAQTKHYTGGECLLREGEPADRLGLILSGSAEAVKHELSGKRLIVSRPGQGSVFGDVLSLSSERQSPVTVTALEDVSALLIPTARLLDPCRERCAGHEKLIRNLLHNILRKYFELHDRLFCVTQPTVRDKVMLFLENASEAAGSRGRVFSIPYDRAALAEYLNVERSALSRELSAMKRDGLIDFYKNMFRILPG
jgi:CRP-like cAMP-binding protein